MKRALMIALVLAALSVFAAAAQDAQTPTEICATAVPAADPETRTYSQPEQVLEPGVDYAAVFCTEAGPVYVDLLEEFAPITVNSFVFLAENGYYNNTTFHRVLENFMAQGGDPTGTGSSSPGYQFEDEFVGFLNFDKPGWLAMANAGPGTNGGQFFITTVPTPHLNFMHTIFGEVLEGQENVLNLKLRDPQQNPDFEGASLDTVVIITDPASVVTTYEAPVPSTQEEILASFEGIQELLPPDVLVLDAETSGLRTTDEVIAGAPEAAQGALGDYLSGHDHDYRVATNILNAACDLQNVGFVRIGYALDVYPSREIAAEALADDALTQVMIDEGYAYTEESENLGIALFTKNLTGCDVDSVEVITYWQRGRFVAMAEVILPVENVALADRWLSEVIGINIFEALLADILRPEIR